MNINLILLALLAFFAGLTELVISGILPYIAEYFDVSMQQAGYLVSFFAFTFAVAAPTIMALTMQVDRKTLLLFFMILFIVGNVLSVLSMSYWVMMLSRIILAISVSMILGLALALSVKVVPVHRQSKAIGFIMMSISSSLVLGTPIGIYLSAYVGWKMLFIIIAVCTMILFFFILKYFPSNISFETVKFSSEWKGLFQTKVLLMHTISFLFFVGQSIFYIYLTPFLMEETHMKPGLIGFVYLVFGASGIIGSGLGGILTDKYGSVKILVLVTLLYTLSMMGLLVTTPVMILFIINIAVWGMLGWVMNAPTQTYLINAAPAYASINQTMSMSFIQIGMAVGGLIGGVIISQTETYRMLIVSGVVILFVACIAAIVLGRMTRKLEG